MEQGMLKLLADDGRPLDITVREQEEGRIAVTRDGREETCLGSRSWLGDSLRFYPRTVTVNGENLETLPWPGLAPGRGPGAGDGRAREVLEPGPADGG